MIIRQLAGICSQICLKPSGQQNNPNSSALTPDAPADDHSYIVPADPVLRSQSAVADATSRITDANFLYLLCIELGGGCSRSALCLLVCHVVCVGASEEVSWIGAQAIVTGVENVRSSRYFTLRQEAGITVDAPLLALNLDDAVPSGVLCASP